jgi:hypothetical protein
MELTIIVLLQMIPLKLVYGNAQLILGLLPIIPPELVFLNAQPIIMIAMLKIIPANVFKIVLIGKLMLKIQQHLA